MTDDPSTSESSPGATGAMGARITMQDGRVSNLLNWFWGSLGLGFLAVLGIAANNLWALNIAVTRMTDNSVIVALQLKDHEMRLRTNERDIGELKGKTFRGVDGYDTTIDEKPRGH